MIPAFNILYRNSSSPTFQVNNNMPGSTSLCVHESFILTEFIKPHKINLIRIALSKVTELQI